MVFSSFDRIRVNSLVHRTDRRTDMLGELRKVGLHNDPRVAFFDAYLFPDADGFRSIGSRGSFHSQLAILTEAAAAGESVLILEDDCDFTAAARSHELPEQWDIFYGGYEASNPDDLQQSDIIGAHFIGFNVEAAKLASRYLKSMLDPQFAPDPTAAAEPRYRADIRPPIDAAYIWFRRAYPELRTVFAVPPLGRQRPSRTDCGEHKLVDRLAALRPAVTLARRVKRNFQGA